MVSFIKIESKTKKELLQLDLANEEKSLNKIIGKLISFYKQNNERYQKRMKKYNREMAEYQEHFKEYKKQVKIFNKENNL